MAVQPAAAYLQMLTRSPRSTTTWAVWLGPYLEPLELVADTVLLPTSCTQVFCMPWALAVVTTSLSLMMPLLSPAKALAS